MICSSCLQYKSLQYCKPVSTLSKEKIKKFIVKKCSLLKNRTDGQFVCNLCLKDIKKNKKPKRSHSDCFKFANFPNYFIKNLKRKCTFKEQNLSAGLAIDQEIYEREYLKLNRLESYLLKLVIPFIRIAHCPRGRYWSTLNSTQLNSTKWRVIMIIGVSHPPPHPTPPHHRNFQGTSRWPRAVKFGV